ncbi:MAG: LptE family protein [Bacteroidales bacterium]|nr:LptE family protein [Bacteroidales bacterium]MBD5288975.1 LptE family protein [Bacteroides sp.]MBD5387128.1 LptE family protein [bacterium]
MKLKLLLLIIISPLLLLTGCKPVFTFNGSILNYDIYKTIYVSEFPIRASLVYPPLQQTFENEILNYVTRQTKLQIADNPNNADINLTGEITGYSLSPQAVGTDAYATETRLTISVRVKYTDNKNSANNIDQTFSAYRQFSSSLMLTDVQDELCQQISEELATLIFNSTLGNW